MADSIMYKVLSGASQPEQRRILTDVRLRKEPIELNRVLYGNCISGICRAVELWRGRWPPGWTVVPESQYPEIGEVGSRQGDRVLKRHLAFLA
jgi:hypothetical protein